MSNQQVTAEEQWPIERIIADLQAWRMNLDDKGYPRVHVGHLIAAYEALQARITPMQAYDIGREDEAKLHSHTTLEQRNHELEGALLGIGERVHEAMNHEGTFQWCTQLICEQIREALANKEEPNA